MSWIHIVPVFACALALASIPGGLLAYLAGVRNYYLLGLAAPLSISLITIAAMIAAPLSTGFGLVPVLAVTALSCAAAVVIRRLLGRPVTPPMTRAAFSRTNWAVMGSALAVAGALIALNFAKIIERPDNFSQTYDNIFHMNAVRYIVESGMGTSLSLGTLGTGPDIFYPAAWHNYVALIQMLTGTSIPVSITAASLVIGAFMWPASCLFLAAAAFGPRTLMILGTAVISAGFSSFPYLMISFGVLYPYLLALVLLPAAIALLCELFRIGVKRTPSDRRVIGLLLAAVVPGMGLAHPSALLFLILVAVALAPLPFIRRLLGPIGTKERMFVAALMVTVLAVSIYAVRQIWVVARPTRGASFWPPFQTPAQALGEIGALAPIGAPITWAMLGIMLVGIYAAFRHRLHRWTLIPMILGSYLYVVVTSFPNDDLRYFITGVWYNDSYRLAALLPIALLPIILVGWRALSDAYERRASRLVRSDTRQSTSALVGINVIAVVLLVAATQGDSVRYAVRAGSQNYGIGESSPLISADEAALLERVPDLVPEEATVVGNPYTGASLVYALADRQTPSPHVGNGQNARAQVLINQLDEMLTNPDVCPVVEEVGPVYVLEFSGGEIHGGNHPFAGIDEVSPATGFDLVAREGEAALWEAVGCTIGSN